MWSALVFSASAASSIKDLFADEFAGALPSAVYDAVNRCESR
jgi:hypothetical protein